MQSTWSFTLIGSSHTQDLALLQSLPREVQRIFFESTTPLTKIQPLWIVLVAIINDENATDVQLEVVALFLGLRLIAGHATWHEQLRSALKCFMDK